MVDGKKHRTKLTDPVLWYRETCPCGTKLEFEAATGMAYDKIKVKWDAAHGIHVESAAAAKERREWYPPKWIKDSADPATSNNPVLTEALVKAARDMERSFTGTTLPRKTKKPTVVEMENINRAAQALKRAARTTYEGERIMVLQAEGTGRITFDEAREALARIDKEEQRANTKVKKKRRKEKE
jgi:hypothetical protein